jgi:formamidopyrimidine-DNA glycosylase
MPELPEVETIVRSLQPLLEGTTLKRIEFKRKDIRWPIPIKEFKAGLENTTITHAKRRSKYLLWENEASVGIFHLGMTGRFTISQSETDALPHTHASFYFESKERAETFWIHFVDPRRFGIIDYGNLKQLPEHKLLRDLGPEPLEAQDLGAYLFEQSRGRTIDIKSFIMDAKIVVGVGNIYASESLFLAGIRPTKAAGKVTAPQYAKLGVAIKTVLEKSIAAGGTTFRDFRHTSGETGYFAQELNVYDREDQPCNNCRGKIRSIRQKGRSTYYCPTCQK